MEYEIQFQKGERVGARSHRTIHVEADNDQTAIDLAMMEKRKDPDMRGYRLYGVFSDNGFYRV